MINLLITFVGQYLGYFAFLVIPHLWLERRRHRILRILVTVALAFAIAEGFKALFYLPRPFIAEGFTPIFSVEPDSSFPSSHTTILTALGASVFFGHQRVGLLIVLLGLLVGIARVLAGVHYPLDILGGLILGTAVAVSVKYLHEKFPYW